MTPRRYQSRRAFTLVEVALAIAIGLLLAGGTVAMYRAVRDNAASSDARERVMKASTMVIEYSTNNFGVYPTSNTTAGNGAFTKMWQAKFPDICNVSPWGGPTGDITYGVTEFAPQTGNASSASAPDVSTIASVDSTKAANLMYFSVTSNQFVKVQQLSNPTSFTARGFAVSIYDRAGNPWFHLAFGK